MKMIASVGLLLLAGGSVALQAQSSAPNPRLDACRQIDSDSKRLRCFDETLDELYGVDQALVERREKYKRDRFGLPVDDTGMRMTELEATVTQVDSNIRNGLTYLALDNGSVWELTSTGGLRVSYKPGMKVIIAESTTGGYRLRVPEKTGFKGVNRIK